jgi:hypothetical protein
MHLQSLESVQLKYINHPFEHDALLLRKFEKFMVFIWWSLNYFTCIILLIFSISNGFRSSITK